jgi:CRISPR-associated protein (TIGR02584 family)
MWNALLFVSGMTPQIITETFWALKARMLPSDHSAIHIITTIHGRRIAEKRLLLDGILSQLSAELGVTPIPQLEFHMIRTAAGDPLDDVRTSEDNVALANTIMATIRMLTDDPHCRIHASLSGGRKTMSFYMGYAMSLYGRTGDALYHVMVPAEFENCPDFFYIPKVPKTVVTRNGRKLSTADATIEIAEIPFLRLRGWVDEPILKAPTIDFAAVTRSVQAALDRPIVIFNDDDCRLSIGGNAFELAPQSFAMYRLLSEACANASPGAGPDGVGLCHRGWLTSDDFATSTSRGTVRFLAILNNLPKASAAKHEYLAGVISREKADTRQSRARMGEIFSPILARLRRSLTENIMDPAVRQQFWVHSKGRNPTRYGLLLQAQQIRLTAPE